MLGDGGDSALFLHSFMWPLGSRFVKVVLRNMLVGVLVLVCSNQLDGRVA